MTGSGSKTTRRRHGAIRAAAGLGLGLGLAGLLAVQAAAFQPPDPPPALPPVFQPVVQPAPTPKPKTPPAKPTPAPKPPAQPQPKPKPAAPAAENQPDNRTAARPAEERGRLAGVPNMIGDFFGLSTSQIMLSADPVMFTQMAPAGFVTNANGEDGASQNPAVPIMILSAPPPGGMTIASSIGNGIDTNGDGQPDTYPISDPGTGPTPVIGATTYQDGTAQFPGPGDPVGNGRGWITSATYAFDPDPNGTLQTILVPPGGGASTRRVKLGENNSPQPRNRVFFTYNYFNNVIAGLGDVNRYSGGAELTYGNGIGSLECRLLMAGTIDSTQNLTSPGARGSELGNLTLIWKHILYQNDNGLISGGCGFGLPTADDTRLILPDGHELLRINNEAVHILPYIAALSSPSDRFFWQAFVQFDFDCNGNSAGLDLFNTGLQPLGVAQDPALLFLDFSAGYVLYDNPDAPLIRSAAALAELHYTSTLQNDDALQGPGFTIEGFTRRFDVLNLSTGFNVQVGRRTMIRPAIVVPLKNDDDKHFDYEATVQANVYF